VASGIKFEVTYYITGILKRKFPTRCDSISDSPQEYSCCMGCCIWDIWRTKFQILAL